MGARKIDILLITIFLILPFLYNCGRISSRHEGRDLKRDTLVDQQVLLENSIYEPEFMINGIALFNQVSLRQKLYKPVFIESDKDEFPKMILWNKSNQKLTLLSYPGDAKDRVSYFILEHYSDVVDFDKPNVFYVNDSLFITNYGLTLDISGDLVREKYASYNIILVEQNTDSTTVLSYLENDYQRNDWLKKYNMPVYIVRYCLVNNIVKKLEFGFQYP